jgi:AcrR family transcriptional regulator
VSAAGEQPRLRADAAASRARILAAARVLEADRRLSMTELAAAADVGRSTLYRHFPTRAALLGALSQGEPGEAVPLPYQSPGALGRQGSVAVDVIRVLNEVPPHLIGDQLVAEARRAAGVAVALYVVDLDGSRLLRLAGTDDFPAELDAPPALGPEIVPEGLPAFAATLREQMPRCTLAPLWLRGRVIGLVLCVGDPVAPLEDIATQGAAALALAGDYTDFVEAARRRKPTTAAAEVQLALLPARIARVTGAQIAGGLLPSYEVGGDWFDYVENRDGVWVAIADASGTGPAAAGLSASVLGALRAARRAGADLPDAVETMDAVVRALDRAEAAVTAIVARWHAPTSTFAWINRGHPPGYVVNREGEMRELGGRAGPNLGADGEAVPPPAAVRLDPGDRVVLLTRGITERSTEDGGTFGVDGVRAAVRGPTTAAATAMAIQRAVLDSWSEPLEDDACLVVLAVD